MGQLSDGSAWLAEMFRANEDVSVVYALGGGSYQIAVYATVGATTLELEPGTYTTSRTANRDFLINKDDLLFFGDTHTPTPGDQIIQTDADGEIYTYEVMEAPGEGAWRWHDSDFETFRIHTTLVKTGF